MGVISPREKQSHQLLAAWSQCSLSCPYPRWCLGLAVTFPVLEKQQKGGQVTVVGTGTCLFRRRFLALVFRKT